MKKNNIFRELTRTAYLEYLEMFPATLTGSTEFISTFETCCDHGCEHNHETLSDDPNQLSTTVVLVLVLISASRVSTKRARQVSHSSDLNLARTRTLEVTSPGNLDRG